MKEYNSVFIATSNRFYEDVEQIKKKLEYDNITVFTRNESDAESSPEQKWNELVKSYKLIKDCDLVYLYSKEGYTENKVIDEVCYAYSCNKDMIFSEEVTNSFINKLSKRKMNLEQLIKYVTM